jgi:hypothetical protein
LRAEARCANDTTEEAWKMNRRIAGRRTHAITSPTRFLYHHIQ